MGPYLFHGVVLPERAQLSLHTQLEFTHLGSGWDGRVEVSIVLNQVVVWVQTEHHWDIFDLRNVVKGIVADELAMLGFIKGHAYDLEVTRVLNRSCGIDTVFGIDIPCLSGRSGNSDLVDAMSKLRDKVAGLNGVFLRRCLRDLVAAMKDADDTAFYCYRAVESLRHHCAAVHGLSGAGKPAQWEKFREVAGCDKRCLDLVKAAADPLRHGDVFLMDAAGREKTLTVTWSVVEGYLEAI